MNTKPDFSFLIAARTIVLAAALGYFAKGRDLSPELAAVIGGAIGLLYDMFAFRLKAWITKLWNDIPMESDGDENQELEER